jgi:major membrane immunogen (membrane-anchored lipoprotein)
MKTYILLTVFFLIIIVSPAYPVNGVNVKSCENPASGDSSNAYADGTYEGYSQDGYSSEPYWGHIRITVTQGCYTEVWFTIRDSSTHEPVDSMYGVTHFSNNPVYMQQCVDDGHGIGYYPQRLMETQNLDKIDAISHETWSYNIFKASAGKALPGTRNPAGFRADAGCMAPYICISPNPFSDVLFLEYELDNSGCVNLCICDCQGRLVEQLVNQEQPAGFHRIIWDGCPAAGTYFYRLQTADFVVSGKFVQSE